MAQDQPAPMPARDPQHVYCPECGTDITRSCSWIGLPIPHQVLIVNILPIICPECQHLLRPAPSPVQLHGSRRQ